MFPPQLDAQLPLQLTQAQCDEYTEVAHCVRDETIAMYEEYLARSPHTPAFDTRDWKLVKKKEHFKIFASREKHHTTAYPSTGSYNRVSEIHQSAVWQPQSKLRCVGSHVGTIEDALYGGATPTEKSMMIRSITIRDEFIDHKTLCDITVPTEDDPYTYTGLKWSARPPYLATMVRPRDMTYVQATGFCTVNNKGKQERAAFFVYHSLENIPGVPEFTDHGFRRCRFSLRVISRPTGHGTLDVFATIASDAGGDLPRKLTTRLSANSLMGIHKAMDNALKKKLAWMRAARSHAIMRGSDSMASFARPRRDSLMGTSVAVCPQCTRELFVLQPLTLCHVCEASVCSRCITTQKLVLGKTKAELAQVSVPTCKGCITVAAKLPVRDLAIHEFVRPFGFDFVDSFPSTASISTNFSSEFSFFGARESAELSASRSDRSSHTSHSSHSSVWVPVPGSISDERDRLWAQIYSLRVQAELTYHETRKHSHATSAQWEH
jgi:hypothetical protein